ncbi:hypothetical protein KC19_9G001800 [Ceratodon purpureus]|uniref:Uncharacterized protein n=1 Tax=Ceratodon purpureus TaxID=3225 RepID=A0A8T0GSK0_CERPU|nr:hypothetical protein KC19_9G001800 [Ceratodon purpureus]
MRTLPHRVQRCSPRSENHKRYACPDTNAASAQNITLMATEFMERALSLLQPPAASTLQHGPVNWPQINIHPDIYISRQIYRSFSYLPEANSTKMLPLAAIKRNRKEIVDHRTKHIQRQEG